MPEAGEGAVYPLVGSTGTDVPIDATGTPYDGASRTKPELPSPPRDGKAYLEVGLAPTQTDASYDLILRDYTDSTDLTTIGASGTVNRQRSSPVYDDLRFGNTVGLRVTITSGSATTGATADINGYLYVEPHG